MESRGRTVGGGGKIEGGREDRGRGRGKTREEDEQKGHENKWNNQGDRHTVQPTGKEHLMLSAYTCTQ